MSSQGMKVLGMVGSTNSRLLQCFEVLESKRNKKNYPINCLHQYRACTELFYFALILACYDVECDLERMDKLVLTVGKPF